MDLDDLRENTTKHTNSSSIENFDNLSQKFQRGYKLHVWIETAVAIFSFLVVVIALIYGENLYPFIIENLAPELVHPDLAYHPLMIFSMLAMAAYCITLPIKFHLSKGRKTVMLSWTLKQRIEAEVKQYEKLQKLWSLAHLWSLTPAAIIGVSFFWGLQISLTGSWIPSIYLLIYFIFVFLSFLGGLWLKKKMVERDINPILQELYQCQQDFIE